MSRTVSDLIAAAEGEWAFWKRPTWNLITKKVVEGATEHTKVDGKYFYAQYVVDTYNPVAKGSATVDSIIAPGSAAYAWSAIGMSYFFAKAGFTKDEFPFSQRHATWVKKFTKAKIDETPALYHGYRVTESSPEVGDLVGYTYAKGINFDKAQKYYTMTGNYQSHTDLVVARRPGEIDVLGANVMNTVMRKTVPLDNAGLIADRTHAWFVVLKRNGF